MIFKAQTKCSNFGEKKSIFESSIQKKTGFFTFLVAYLPQKCMKLRKIRKFIFPIKMVFLYKIRTHFSYMEFYL